MLLQKTKIYVILKKKGFIFRLRWWSYTIFPHFIVKLYHLCFIKDLILSKEIHKKEVTAAFEATKITITNQK